jgi:hypothetical protein
MTKMKNIKYINSNLAFKYENIIYFCENKISLFLMRKSNYFSKENFFLFFLNKNENNLKFR